MWQNVDWEIFLQQHLVTLFSTRKASKGVLDNSSLFFAVYLHSQLDPTLK
jgi:hypothetical protein